MASNYGSLDHGQWVIQKADGTWGSAFKDTPGASWAWFRGEPSWSVGFLHTYPITLFLGVLVSFLTVAYFWKRMKYSWDTLYMLVIIIVPSAILGARLWFLISSGNADYWKTWYKFEGLSIHGGVMVSSLCALTYLYTQRHHIDIRTAVGIILPSVVVGQVIGRWGNFDNHEVYGAVVNGESLNWLTFIKPNMLIITDRSDPIGSVAYRQPFFFYESMTNLFGYIILIWVLLRKNWVKPGVTGGLYLLFYGIIRIIMEPLRDPVDIMKVNGFPMSIFIAALWIVLALIFIIWWQFFPKYLHKLIPAYVGVANGIVAIISVLIMPVRVFFVWDKVKNKDYRALLLPWVTKKFFSKEYEAITPVKPRRVFFFGPKVETKGTLFLYWGKQVPNKVKLYIPIHEEEKWSKKEINQGYKNKVKS